MRVLFALRDAVADRRPAVLVTVSEAHGSTPREAGARMLVTESEAIGTVGGGALEMEGIAEARRMLVAKEREAELDVPLGPRIGQCCGGRVLLSLALADASSLDALEREIAGRRQGDPHVYLFGAGHTGQALARALEPLPLQMTVVDVRADRLAELPAGVSRRQAALPEAEIRSARPGAAFLVMTHDHALDFILAAAALERRDAVYVGMIGSRTKRETFRRYLATLDREADIGRLVLPIGGSVVRDKRPEVIAAMVAAELLSVFSKGALDSDCATFAHAQSECDKKATDLSRIRADAATP